jgi:hypothetical protein
MELHLVEARHILQQRSTLAGAAEQRHRFAESHVVVEFDEANNIAAAAAAIAVEQVLDRIHQETGLVLEVQWAQPHEPPAGDAPGGFPILCLQVVQQRNLLFDRVHGGPHHGEFASRSRLRPTAGQSQARMVGARKKVGQPGKQNQKHFRLQHRLDRRRQAQRRSVAGSGKRLGSFVCGADCSQPPPRWHVDSQACSRHR